MQRDLTAIRAAMLHAHDVLHSARTMLPESDLGHAEIGEAMRGLRDAAALASAPAADLTDDQIDACVGNLGMAPYSVLAGPDEIRKFARKLLAERASHPQAQVVEAEPDIVSHDGGVIDERAGDVDPWNTALPHWPFPTPRGGT